MLYRFMLDQSAAQSDNTRGFERGPTSSQGWRSVVVSGQADKTEKGFEIFNEELSAS